MKQQKWRALQDDTGDPLPHSPFSASKARKGKSLKSGCPEPVADISPHVWDTRHMSYHLNSLGGYTGDYTGHYYWAFLAGILRV